MFAIILIRKREHAVYFNCMLVCCLFALYTSSVSCHGLICGWSVGYKNQ